MVVEAFSRGFQSRLSVGPTQETSLFQWSSMPRPKGRKDSAPRQRKKMTAGQKRLRDAEEGVGFMTGLTHDAPEYQLLSARVRIC